MQLSYVPKYSSCWVYLSKKMNIYLNILQTLISFTSQNTYPFTSSLLDEISSRYQPSHRIFLEESEEELQLNCLSRFSLSSVFWHFDQHQTLYGPFRVYWSFLQQGVECKWSFYLIIDSFVDIDFRSMSIFDILI